MRRKVEMRANNEVKRTRRGENIKLKETTGKRNERRKRKT